MRRLLRAVGALTLGVGVVAQFIQHTDPTPPLAYFTVWSAILGALTLAVSTRRGRELPVAVRGAATVGCVVSGVIFAAVIAPATETGTWFQPWDDFWVRTANLLMHGLGPVLIAADFIATPTRANRPWRQAAMWCTWPLAYIVTIFVTQAVDGSKVPYPFLNPQVNSIGLLIGSITALTLLFLLVGRILLFLNGKVHRNVVNRAA